MSVIESAQLKYPVVDEKFHSTPIRPFVSDLLREQTGMLRRVSTGREQAENKKAACAGGHPDTERSIKGFDAPDQSGNPPL